MTNADQLRQVKRNLELIPDLEIFETISDKERFSRDFYDYSPILSDQFQNCIADLVVRPKTIEAACFVAESCHRYGIPLTLRGSGTGNYGQCVPLKGGVVMIMNGLQKIRKYDSETGVVTVEAGCLLREINNELLHHGRQLRLLPSTWRSATIGGFIAGGSGGIGSIRWGFLRDPGHLLGVELLTVEGSPRKLELDASDAEALNHAYGTNGIITALSLATTNYLPWHEVIVDCSEWTTAVDLLKQCACSAVDLYLATLLENNIVENIPKWCGDYSGDHRILLLVAPDGVSTIRRICLSLSTNFRDLGPENLSSGKTLRELTWNHTTLHMRAIDPSWTYLQMLLPETEIQIIEEISSKWGKNVLWHLEGVRQHGSQRLASLPLVRWQGKEAMYDLINQFKKMGAIIFNPHVITVEDGGLGVVDSDQVRAKSCYDPKSILNPGKLKGSLKNL